MLGREGRQARGRASGLPSWGRRARRGDGLDGDEHRREHDEHCAGDRGTRRRRARADVGGADRRELPRPAAGNGAGRPGGHPRGRQRVHLRRRRVPRHGLELALLVWADRLPGGCRPCPELSPDAHPAPTRHQDRPCRGRALGCRHRAHPAWLQQPPDVGAAGGRGPGAVLAAAAVPGAAIHPLGHRARSSVLRVVQQARGHQPTAAARDGGIGQRRREERCDRLSRRGQPRSRGGLSHPALRPDRPRPHTPVLGRGHPPVRACSCGRGRPLRAPVRSPLAAPPLEWSRSP